MNHSKLEDTKNFTYYVYFILMVFSKKQCNFSTIFFTKKVYFFLQIQLLQIFFSVARHLILQIRYKRKKTLQNR